MLLDEHGDLMSDDAEAAARAAGLPIAMTSLGERMLPIVVVSPRQIRHALNLTGDRAAVEAAVAAGDQALQDWWEYATDFRRDHPEVIAMGIALAKTPADLDALFDLARSL